jgi:uncharacterized phage protein (TIGR02218 family)
MVPQVNHSGGTRGCRHDLGDAKCTVDLGPLTVAGSVFVQTLPSYDARLTFSTTLVQADGYFDYGSLTWTSGANAGYVSEVKQFLQFVGEIRLFEKTPFDIAEGDTFTIVPGCDKNPETCGGKFSNFDNFGGFQQIPGSLEAMKTP